MVKNLPKCAVESDWAYSLLTSEAEALRKEEHKGANYVYLAWTSLGSMHRGNASNDLINDLINGLTLLSQEYLNAKGIRTDLFEAVAVCIYLCRVNNLKIPKPASDVLAEMKKELVTNAKLRTPELVGTVLFFGSQDPDASDPVLRAYLKTQAIDASKTSKYFLIIDSTFGDPAICEESWLKSCVANEGLLNLEKTAKGLIIASLANLKIKDDLYGLMMEKLKNNHLVPLIKQISELTLRDSLKTFTENRSNNIDLGNFQHLDPKTLGLCILALKIAGYHNRVVLAKQDYNRLEGAWREQKFGFGINRNQLKILHAVGLFLIAVSLTMFLISLRLYEPYAKVIVYLMSDKFKVESLGQLPFPTLLILISVLLLITYHRIFSYLMEHGEMKGIITVMMQIPIIGSIVRNLRGQG